MSRGDRNRNARLERLRVLVPASNAIVGIDLADSKQIVFQPRHEPVKDAGVSPRNALAGRPIDFRGPGCQAAATRDSRISPESAAEVTAHIVRPDSSPATRSGRCPAIYPGRGYAPARDEPRLEPMCGLGGKRMEYEEIIEETRRASGGLTGEAAERAAQATLQTLAERLPSGEARHILAELPAELKPWIYTETDAAAFGIDEFLDQVAQREGVDIETALSHARAVFFALGDALSPREVQHLAASLPETYQPLVAEAQRMYLDIMPADQFWARVAQRLSTGEATARHVTGAVLQTLAERIAAGQVEDLIAQLDPLLHQPLRRGLSAAGPDARRMPLAEFLRRIAGREGADVDEADLFEETFGHARAVFTTLASAVDPKEWSDVLVELPEEYRSLIPERTA
jgi:uncharacterized protein (DUF2267 family)